jgi:HD domain
MTAGTDDLLELPASPVAREALDLVVRNTGPAVANHSVRGWLFAKLFAEHRRIDVDHDLLFYSCVLHDIGLSELGNRHQRFEVDGADVAAEFLTERGLAAVDVDSVWEAIALHTSFGIADRRGALTAVTHGGIALDFGIGSELVTDGQGQRIHEAYPRLAMATSLVDIIVGQARSRPEKAPGYTMVAELLRQRSTPPHSTDMEALAGQGRWGS